MATPSGVALALWLAGALAAPRLSAQCPDGSAPPCRVSRVGAPAPNSVAVLYFSVLDTAGLYLAEGVTEDIATSLGRVPRLLVKTPTAVRRAQRLTPADFRAIGAGLAVRYLVDGRLRWVGDHYRVSVRLVRAQDEMTTWGETYDRTSDQLLDVPAEIAGAVAAAIGGTLSPVEQTAVRRRPTRDPQAYDEYMRGNFLLASRNPQQARAAVQAYERALARDPDFVPAIAGASLAYALFLDWSWPFPGLTRDSLLARGQRLAQRAVHLDSGSSGGWLALGYSAAHAHPYTFEGVLEALDSATRLDPNNAEAWHQYGYFRWLTYRDSAALVALHRALDVDPARGVTLEHVARVYFYERRYGDAKHWMDSAVAVDSTSAFHHAYRGRVEKMLGEQGLARRDAELAAMLSPRTTGSLQEEYTLGIADFVGGDSASARRHVVAMTAMLPDSGPLSYVEGVWTATLLAELGDGEGAFRFLERVRPAGITFGRYLFHPAFDGLRSDPRFHRLVIVSAPPGMH